MDLRSAPSPEQRAATRAALFTTLSLLGLTIVLLLAAVVWTS